MGRWRQTTVICLLGLGLTGCPPTGDPPPFDPLLADQALPADQTPGPDEGPDPCADLDGDGYVTREGCPLPAGDCAPTDPDRNPGATERCNRLDDDCDGVVDEGNPEGGAPCETEAQGVCAAGQTICSQGSLRCEQLERPSDERCNGRDDDCDGTVDESVPGLGGRCETGEPGACGPGNEACVGGQVSCVARAESGPEQCNGIDDDCDGTVDEGDPGGGGACGTGLQGICAVGVERCQGGALRCTATVEPEAERCNRLDDDCDGRVDETFPTLGEVCRVGVGACARDSSFVCAAGEAGVVCDVSAGDGTLELCNGLDDDCDERIDEGFDLGIACTNGLGICARPGQTVCGPDGDAVICDAEPGESFPERCNGLDDDCDGFVDEDFPTLGEACVDAGGECPSPGTVACAADGAGTICDAAPVRPEAERCNGLDDDCDGFVDEAFPDLGADCAVGVGACGREGALICTPDGAGLACSVAPAAPQAEACNGQDDDCDGRIDNGAPCLGPPAGQVLSLRIAEFGEARCPDLDGDGLPDNALGGLAGLLNPPLRARFTAQVSPIIIRAPGLPDDALDLEWLAALLSPDGLRPRPEALSPAGEARQRLTGLVRVDGRLTAGLPGPLQVVSPLLFIDDAAPPYLAASRVDLREVRARGPLALGPAGGLVSNGLVLSGWLPRAELLAAYQAADAACAAALEAAPAGCAGRLSPDLLAANLQADLERDPDLPGADAVSVCLVAELAEVVEPQSNPAAGPIPCQADSDCYQGLVCRALPWQAEGAVGAALERRCGLPGPGGRPTGAGCDTHRDCRTGLCVAATAGGGRCTALCAADGECPADHACRGVPVPDVEGAVDQGGRSAFACVPLLGSGAPCAGGCPAGETCTPWLGGEAGQAGGRVLLEPSCAAPDAQGAPLGAPCAGPLDCARGLGCVPDLEGALVCAPTCAAPGDCPAGSVCFDRTFLARAATQDPLVHGVCLAVPAALGSGGACAADARCPAGEICTETWLARAGTHSRYCAAGAGFFSVGQPCAADADCAHGTCAAGRCAGPCETSADCGDSHGCVPEAWADAEGRIVGGACAPAAAACVRDRDCNQADPLCAGDRCVCDANRCRLGCRPGGICAEAAWCQPDGVCARFCRDDAGEPNDSPATATRLPVGRAEPALVRTAELCARSPVDWYRFSTGGQPFEARVLPLSPGPVFDFGLYDAGGGLIAAAQPGPGGSLVVGIPDAAAAAARLGQDLSLRIRASGTFDRALYRLVIDLRFPDCPDPAAEPRDASWQAEEILASPGALAAADLDGWICPQDEDWFGVFLSPGDRLVVDLDNQGNGAERPADLELELLGPDWPDLGRAQVRARLPAAGPLEYVMPAMFCDPGTLFCALGDGTATDVFCGNSPEDCYGIAYFLRLRGAGAFDSAAYQLQARVERATAPLCVPDLFEHDGNFQFADRIHASLPPALRAYVGAAPSLPIGQQVDLTRLRACGGPGPINLALDADNFMVWLNLGEQLLAGLSQAGGQRLQLDTYKIDNQIQRLSAEASTDPELFASIDVRESGFYGVGVLRAGSDGQAGYTIDTPYALSLVRLPVGFVPDLGCEAPVRINLINNTAEIRGSTEGANDNHRPLDCLGGSGPDRTFVVRVPAGAGVLRATAVRDDGRFDPTISIRTDCGIENSELACNDDDADAIDPFGQAKTQAVVQGGAAGRDVFVIVDSHDPTTAGAFRLQLRYLDGAECDLDTGICQDACAGVVCPGGQRCDPDDGQCVDCQVDGQCPFGARCLDRRCVPGADRLISSWGANGDDEPRCPGGGSQCTVDEQCSQIPFTADRYCLLACSANLACPDGFRCCRPPLLTNPEQFCVPSDNPLGGLCQ